MNSFRKILQHLNPFSPIKIILKNKSLWKNLLERRITSQYRGSLLGCLWAVIQPLFMLLVYIFVFHGIFKVRWNVQDAASEPLFAATMFCGLSIFNIFSESVNSSVTVMTSNVNFIKKTVFPLELLPLTQCFGTAIPGAFWFLLIVIAKAAIMHSMQAFCWSMLIFPILYILFLAAVSGVCFLVSSLGVYFKDTRFFVGMFFQVLFFITPIFYPISQVPEKYRFILNMNPFSWYVVAIRNSIIYGTFPDALMWLKIVITSYVVWQFGWIWFKITRKGFADVL